MEKICWGGFQWRKQSFLSMIKLKNKRINILVEEQQRAFSFELLGRSRSNTKSFIGNKKIRRKSNNESAELKYSLISATKANVTRADILKNLTLFRLQRQIYPWFLDINRITLKKLLSKTLPSSSDMSSNSFVVSGTFILCFSITVCWTETHS